ncbi:MAG: PAS domain S-box protein, partial [Planctomycetes bacterium]|nr:PAS domain S-box protein [Planctomycetota bacterium]
FAACLERAFAGGGAQVCELRLWRDGAPPRSVRLTALAADDTRACRVVVVDVTEIRRAESSVAEWKNRYEATIDASGQLLYDWDPATNLVSYAGDTVRILGFTLAELAGGLAHWLSLIHPDDRAGFETEVARVIATRTPFRMEYRVARKDGAWLPVQDDGNFVLDAAGRITRMVGFVSDISARRDAERAIRESEERYRMLWETTSDAVLIIDERGIIQYANPALRTVLGHDPAAVVGQSLSILQPERLRQGHLEGLARFLADGSKRLDWRATQVPGLHRDGHEVPLEISFSHTLIGGQHRFAGFLRDITERKRIEDALRATEARSSAVLRALSEGLVLMDLQGRVLLINDAVERVLGFPITDLNDPAGGIRDRLLRGDGTPFPLAEQPSAVALRTGRPVHDVEVGVPRPDGSYAWICSNSELVRDTDGTALGVVSSFFDITHRKLGEARLRASEERYRRIVETANEGIWTIDGEARTSFVNPKMAAMLGWTPAEMLGRPIFDFMDEEGRMAAERNLARRRQGIAEQHDFTFRRRDGSELWTLVATNPIHGENGAYVGAMAMVTDISERRRLEDELRQAQKMEAVGRLAGGIAHDFNNQLTVIQGYGQLALKRAEDEGLAKHLRHIVTATEHSADLVRQLLSFSRKGRHAIVAVDLHGILTELQDVLGRSLDKRIRIELALRAEAAVVTGDRGLLQSAFLNLALNARDAMPEGGMLRFATSEVDLDAEQVARLGGGMACTRHLRVTVSDSGQGMSAEVQRHLFEPFFSTKAPGQGTGLGLASVYGTVKQHEGGIEVVSTPGRGTVFQVFLPLAATQAVAAASGPDRPIPGAAARILMIEDEGLVGALVEDTLSESGHVVVSRSDGAAGVEHFRGHWRQIDLVILDMNMPVMGGPETFAALRQIDAGVRVLVVSGYSESGGIEALLSQGAVGFLAKPFRPEVLVQRIAELLAGPAGP